MSDLARLRIWDDPAIRGALSWYLDVAENRRPAKFRIAATVSLRLDPAASSEDVRWAELDDLTPVFLAGRRSGRARRCRQRRMARACWSYAASSYTACSPTAISVHGIAASTAWWAPNSVRASSPPARGSARLGTPNTTAIVHPRKFTSAIMSAAQRNGAQLCPGRVTGITRSADGPMMRRVEVDGRVVEADAVVVAMGPWSLLATNWMALPAVFGQRSPSVVYDTGTDVPPEALFLDYHEEDGSVSTVEVFPCADGSTHVTAFSDIVPLPLDPATVTPDPDAIDRLKAICERLSPVFRSDRIIARQACFRPVTEDGLPLIGKVPQLDGAYVATGHNVWGILNAPATGEALAELITEGVSRAIDLTPFAPARLWPLDPLLLRSANETRQPILNVR
jgi:glycine/D-amino acid oxidase-like deaminating enzyme